MDKFLNKYRIPSARLQTWDYGWNAPYFVTICTANRECFFGNIVDNEMKLSAIGELANQFWAEIPKHFPFVILDAFVVMPNHLHGILIFDKTDDRVMDKKNEGVGESGNGVHDGGDVVDCYNIPDGGGVHVETRQCLVSTININNATAANNVKQTTAPPPLTPGQKRFQNQGKNTLSSIIGAYKSVVTTKAHPINAGFGWQSRFHDHIIRDDASWNRISEYILTNPANWTNDKFFE